MTKKEKYNAIINAYTTMTRNNGKTIHIITDQTPKEVTDALLDMQKENDSGFDMSYEIFNDASRVLDNCSGEIEEIESLDFNEVESASVYTAQRLAYLNSHNQYDITQIMKETEAEDIATACAIWYDRKVSEACEALRAYILA